MQPRICRDAAAARSATPSLLLRVCVSPSTRFHQALVRPVRMRSETAACGRVAMAMRTTCLLMMERRTLPQLRRARQRPLRCSRKLLERSRGTSPRRQTSSLMSKDGMTRLTWQRWRPTLGRCAVSGRHAEDGFLTWSTIFPWQIEMDGLLWGAAKLEEVGYGIKKLRITVLPWPTSTRPSAFMKSPIPGLR